MADSSEPGPSSSNPSTPRAFDRILNAPDTIEVLSANDTETETESESIPLVGERKNIFPRRQWATGKLRSGETISSHRAVLTLSKSFVGCGCFSLSYAWKLCGIWVAIVIQFFVALINWYGSHIIVRSSQRLASLSKRPALDYGHLAKKVCDYSEFQWLRNNSKKVMYLVNVSNAMVQIGSCSVNILFVARNIQKVILMYTSTSVNITGLETVTFIVFVIICSFLSIKMISVFAFLSVLFFLLGAGAIIQYCFQQPSQWSDVPGYTDPLSTLAGASMMMYTFEGQQLILPIENKMRNSDDFLHNCGVLPTTYIICTCLMCAVAFYGYNAFGENTAQTLTLNLPKSYSAVNIFLVIQTVFGVAVAIYAVYSMFWNGFNRKFVNYYDWTRNHLLICEKLYRAAWLFLAYIIAISVPKLDVLIPLVGSTAGTLCAIIYPITLEMILFMPYWRETRSLWNYRLKLIKKLLILLVGFIILIGGFTSSVVLAIKAFK